MEDKSGRGSSLLMKGTWADARGVCVRVRVCVCVCETTVSAVCLVRESDSSPPLALLPKIHLFFSPTFVPVCSTHQLASHDVNTKPIPNHLQASQC